MLQDRRREVPARAGVGVVVVAAEDATAKAEANAVKAVATANPKPPAKAPKAVRGVSRSRTARATVCHHSPARG